MQDMGTMNKANILLRFQPEKVVRKYQCFEQHPEFLGAIKRVRVEP